MPDLLVGKSDTPVTLNLGYANRHGLIAGATGTGKTITLQVLAEGFARQGVPVFAVDAKGDLAGIAKAGKPHPKIDERIARTGVDDFALRGFPTVFWDLFGKQGHPLRTTLSDLGPLLLTRLLELNETQESILNILFRYADQEGLLLLDLKDLRSLLNHLSEHKDAFQKDFGTISPATIGAIQRRLVLLEQAGAEQFFGEPALDIRDFMRCDSDGIGQINLLAGDQLMQSPRLYATFILWLISELFEELPEVGDPEKPRLVFFFDEAHLLFNDAPKALIDKVEQVVKLIRSKGIGIYFVTQNPLDIPDGVLGQLGNRVQHALRAFTPKDQKAVRAAAATFRPNPALDTEQLLTTLGVGEALVSTLQDQGIPGIVQHTVICPPRSQIGPLKATERQPLIEQSPLYGRYDTLLDRHSAYEMLTERQQASTPPPAPPKGPGGRQRQTATEAFGKSVVRAIGSRLGREIVRGLLGAIFKKR